MGGITSGLSSRRKLDDEEFERWYEAEIERIRGLPASEREKPMDDLYVALEQQAGYRKGETAAMEKRDRQFNQWYVREAAKVDRLPPQKQRAARQTLMKELRPRIQARVAEHYENASPMTRAWAAFHELLEGETQLELRRYEEIVNPSAEERTQIMNFDFLRDMHPGTRWRTTTRRGGRATEWQQMDVLRNWLEHGHDTTTFEDGRTYGLDAVEEAVANKYYKATVKEFKDLGVDPNDLEKIYLEAEPGGAVERSINKILDQRTVLMDHITKMRGRFNISDEYRDN